MLEGWFPTASFFRKESGCSHLQASFFAVFRANQSGDNRANTRNTESPSRVPLIFTQWESLNEKRAARDN